ncbi:MAG: hypothetical protein ETSY2_27245 [Candidatus Entotheonella gemina]|uniref:Uncharacterized protein n=1 Tax=Candidatus Entotheonella gemina TaxID=1429439 RepID=W4M3D7_9BACT|nr:MAG: hypothetical protein ETSY2_27245 [Candidatus Entotheonella gemina]
MVWPLFLASIAVAAVVCDIEAQTANAAREDVAPPDVYVRTLLVRDALERIRLEMGKPKDTRRELRVAKAEPREVFSQALTLFHKANRLSFDLTRERAELPEKPVGTLRSVHVQAVVDAVLAQLQRVKATLGSVEASPEPPRDPAMTPSDVFRSIVQANRQVNLLLDRQLAPSDVFRQVTLAVGYAAQLRTRFAGTRMPEAPPFERRKRPADVYHRLAECFARVRTIMARSGFSALTLDHHPEAVTSSDVYDIASLIVSELSFLHAQVGGALPPPDPYYPGRKFPADVYRRAGLLEALLIDLQALVEVNPSWLQAQDERE